MAIRPRVRNAEMAMDEVFGYEALLSAVAIGSRGRSWAVSLLAS